MLFVATILSLFMSGLVMGHPDCTLKMLLRSSGMNDPGHTQFMDSEDPDHFSSCIEVAKGLNAMGISNGGSDYSPSRNGIGLVAIDDQTGQLLMSNTYDTHASATAGDRLASMMQALIDDAEREYIVGVAVHGDGSVYGQAFLDVLDRYNMGCVDKLFENQSFVFVGSTRSQGNFGQGACSRKKDGEGPIEKIVRIELFGCEDRMAALEQA